MTGRLTRIAVLIPLLGLVALIGRAEFAKRSGVTWKVAISGYDPRDLIHGHYLRYRYDFNWQGPHTCGPGREGNVKLDADCCLCLSRANGDGSNPPVRQTSCDEAASCDGRLRSRSVLGAQRYLVPEERARELEAALRDRQAALELVCGPNGAPAIHELHLDGRPWREVLE